MTKDEMAYEVACLAEVVKLAAFAVEARRVLGEISRSSGLQPDPAAALFRLNVLRFNEWEGHADVAHSVLLEVGYRLEDLAEAIEMNDMRPQGARREASNEGEG